MENEEAVTALVKAAVTAERKRIAEKARDRAASFKARGLVRGLIASFALDEFANHIDPENAKKLKITVPTNPLQP